MVNFADTPKFTIGGITNLNSAINEDINVYKTAINQYRPYLSLRDAFEVFRFSIDKG